MTLEPEKNPEKGGDDLFSRKKSGTDDVSEGAKQEEEADDSSADSEETDEMEDSPRSDSEEVENADQGNEFKVASLKAVSADGRQTPLGTDANGRGQERQQPQRPQQSSHLATLRTYQGDSQEAMREEKTSMADIAVAEQRKRQSEEGGESRTDWFSFKRVGAALLSILLLVGALGIGGYIFYFNDGNLIPRKNTFAPEQFILTDEQVEISVRGKEDREIIREFEDLRHKNIPLDSFLGVYLTKTVISDEGKQEKELLTTTDFLELLDANAPVSLTRALGPEFTLGFHGFDENQVFLIFEVNAYEEAFASMLSWEGVMEEDLLPLIGPRSTARATTTATSSSSVGNSDDTTGPLDTYSGQLFIDRVIQNQDTRVLELPNTNVRLIYSFPSRQRLVITTNEDTLKEVFSAMNRKRFTQ